jgi:hypothetical protein
MQEKSSNDTSNSETETEPDNKNEKEQRIIAVDDKDIDYTDPKNFTVDFFVNHVKTKTKKKGEGYALITRWKGFTAADDTKECLKQKAKELPDLVIKYLKSDKVSTQPIRDYILNNQKGTNDY